MKKVGLFFGTFNPVHIGHLALAEFIQKTTDLEEVWLVVTPLNPFKKKSNLLPDRERLHLVRLALEDQMGLKASDIEFNLPKPNYTAQTLAYLREKYPEIIFSVIMGEDNIKTLHKWRNYESIADNHDIFVYGMPITTECVGLGNLESFQPSKYPWLVFVLVIKIGKDLEKE